MNKSCRCALATLIAAIGLAAAIVTVGLSTGHLMTNDTVKARSTPSINNLQPKTRDRQPLIAPHKFDQSRIRQRRLQAALRTGLPMRPLPSQLRSR